MWLKLDWSQYAEIIDWKADNSYNQLNWDGGGVLGYAVLHVYKSKVVKRMLGFSCWVDEETHVMLNASGYCL